MPSTVGATDPAVLNEWRRAQDLYRYKFAPAYLTDFRWVFEMHFGVSQVNSAAWEEMFEKNDTRRNPVKCASLHDMYEVPFPFHHITCKRCRAIVRAMGIPSFPFLGKINGQTRIRDYFEIIFNEDYMVMQPGALQALDDAALFDYAWRRFLAPVDKNLTKAQLLERVQDYHTFLGGDKFLETAKAPNLFVTIAYCMGSYNEPAYLEGDISELDGDDYAHLQGWGRDMFLRRLEFENGPLRDQVEAHSIKSLEERQKKLSE
jgi:hypothetical protein